MRIVRHLKSAPACPHLPLPDHPCTAAAMREFGLDRGERFYEAALKVAHSLWLQGLPAQALLLINRAFGADLQGGESVLDAHPLPYRAAAWIMRERNADQFIGNPRRHFQHLATRMVEPRREQRAWRAWACWKLARTILPSFPADHEQLLTEGVVEPDSSAIEAQLKCLGIPGEAKLWKQAEAEALDSDLA
ncbi:MAG: hypothetical protein ACI8UO_002280 [Verrucomicrobiales bacterium]|jgi:hypothetical protein